MQVLLGVPGAAAPHDERLQRRVRPSGVTEVLAFVVSQAPHGVHREQGDARTRAGPCGAQWRLHGGGKWLEGWHTAAGGCGMPGVGLLGTRRACVIPRKGPACTVSRCPGCGVKEGDSRTPKSGACRDATAWPHCGVGVASLVGPAQLLLHQGAARGAVRLYHLGQPERAHRCVRPGGVTRVRASV